MVMFVFTFLDPGDPHDDQLRLRLTETETPAQSMWRAPTYRFSIRLASNNEPIGKINLRVGDTKLLTHYTGQVGYAIDEPHRGHHFAERACRLLLPFAFRHQLSEVWITCAPDNIPSRRTLERLGALLVETVDVPDDYPLPEGAIRQKCRFRISSKEPRTR
jgi:predicted acetyltransferase